MLVDDLEPKYFNTRNIYQSKITGKRSHSLTDFALDHPKLNTSILSRLAANEKKDLAYFQAYQFTPDFEWVIGVEKLKSTDSLIIYDNIDDYEWFKNRLVYILKNKIEPYRNTRNLLLLSGGIDSQLILAIFLDLQIPFTAIHITYNLECIETKHILEQQKYWKYELDIVHMDNLDENLFKDVRYRYTIVNPAYSFTAWNDLLMTYSCSLYDNCDYVFSGLRAETVLQQVPEGLCDITDNSKDLDNVWGSYIKHNLTENISLDFKNRYSTYKNWSETYLRGLSVPSRNLYNLEVAANKTMVYPFLDKDLHEYALSLTGEAKIKNIYKHTQLDILKEYGFTIINSKQEIHETIDPMHSFKTEGPVKYFIKEWMKNYIRITKSVT